MQAPPTDPLYAASHPDEITTNKRFIRWPLHSRLLPTTKEEFGKKGVPTSCKCASMYIHTFFFPPFAIEHTGRLSLLRCVGAVVLDAKKGGYDKILLGSEPNRVDVVCMHRRTNVRNVPNTVART